MTKRRRTSILDDLQSFRGQMYRLEGICQNKSEKEKDLLNRGCYLVLAGEVKKVAISVDTMIEYLRGREDVGKEA